ncbi:MAG: tetratricopeptide repeat protein [Chloroflexaceae bacterium]|nr:tetratricopeptide repeat protein [Chloroflexaceae bacterium]
MNTASGLPGDLYLRLREVLMGLDTFRSDATLQAIFHVEPLHTYLDDLPESTSKGERVERTIGYLLKKNRSDGTPVLQILLEILRDRIGDPGDNTYQALHELARRVAELRYQRSSSAPTLVQPGDEHSKERASEGLITVTYATLDQYVPRADREWKRPHERFFDSATQRAIERCADLENLHHLLNPAHRHSGRVVIVGMAGVGKSTLVSLYVHHYSDTYAGGVLCSKLGFEFRDPAQAQPILQDWAAYACYRLKMGLQFDSSAVNVLLDNRGPILVVLDDVWSGTAIEPLINALPPNVRLLVTTRHMDVVAAVPAATHYELGRLSNDDAIMLLRHQIGAYDEVPTGFPADLENDLVGTLEYHAQAIVIAARVLRGQRMERREAAAHEFLKKIRTGQPPLPPLMDHLDEPKHVVQALEFSYLDLKRTIDEAAQPELSGDMALHRVHLLGAIGPVDADFSADLAAALWGNPPDTDTFLVQLDSRSLITPAGQGRWHQHVLVRNYNKDLLSPDHLHTGSLRYIDYVLTLVDTIFSNHQNAWDAIRPDLPHVTFVGNTLADQADHLLSVIPITIEMLVNPEPLDVPDISHFTEAEHALLDRGLRFARAVWQYVLSRPATGDMGQRWLALGLGVARLRNDIPGTILFVHGLGQWHLSRGSGHFDHARAYFSWMLNLSDISGERAVRVEALNCLGWTTWVTGTDADAMSLFDEALTIARELDLSIAEGDILNNIGFVYQSAGNVQRALEVFEQALPITRQAKNLEGVVRVLNNLGMLYLQTNNSERAIQFFQEAFDLVDDSVERELVMTLRNNISLAYLDLEKPEEAQQFVQRLCQEANELEDRTWRLRSLYLLGMMEMTYEHPREAINALNEGLALWKEDEGDAESLLHGMMSFQRARAFLSSPDYDDGAKLKGFQDACAALEQAPENRWTIEGRARTHYILGLLFERIIENLAAAVEHFRQAVKLLPQIDLRQETIYCLIFVCGYLARQGDEQELRVFFDETLGSHPELFLEVLGSAFTLLTPGRNPESDQIGEMTPFQAAVLFATEYIPTTSWRQALAVIEEKRDLLFDPSMEETVQNSFHYYEMVFSMFENISDIDLEQIRHVFQFYKCVLARARTEDPNQVLRYAEIETEFADYIYWWWATQHREAGNHENALDCIERALRLSRKSSNYHTAGLIFLERGEYGQALNMFRLALKAIPGYAPTLRSRGKLLFELGDNEAAITDLNALIHLQPGTANYQQRAIVLLFRGDTDDAEDACNNLTDALEMNERDAELYYFLALAHLCRMRSGNKDDKDDTWQQVRHNLDEATRWNDGEDELINRSFWRAIGYRLRDRLDDAEFEMRAAADGLPEDTNRHSLRLRARIALMHDQAEDAQADYENLPFTVEDLSVLRTEQLYLRMLARFFPERQAVVEANRTFTARLDALVQPRRTEPIAEELPPILPPLPDPLLFPTPLFDDTAYAQALEDAACPSITTDRQFAEALCGDAALLFRTGDVHLRAGAYLAAANPMSQALAIARTSCGRNHPALVPMLNALGEIESARGSFPDAAEHFREALLIRILGMRRQTHDGVGKTLSIHVDDVRSINGLAGLLPEADEDGQVIRLLELVLSLRRRAFGEQHVLVAQSCINLAVACKLYCTNAEAQRWLDEAVKYQNTIFDTHHPDVALRHNVAAILMRAHGNLDEAIRLCGVALRIQRDTLRAKHPELALSLSNAAVLSIESGNESAALPQCLDAQRILAESIGKDHAAYLVTLLNLAFIYAVLNEHKAACDCFASVPERYLQGALQRYYVALKPLVAEPGQQSALRNIIDRHAASPILVRIERGMVMPVLLPALKRLSW